VRQPLAAPLGFALPGSSDASLARALTRAPPTRFVTPAEADIHCATEYHSADAWPHPSVPPRRYRVGWDNPRRVLAPVRSRTFERSHCLGYLFHLAPRRTSLPTGRRSLDS